jgi:hypothetical protein
LNTPPCGCWCDPNAPLEAGACGDAAAGTYPMVQWSCYSYSPPTGCECRVVPPPIL